MKAVVVRLGALGDVVLTTGVVRFWHEKYGMRATVITKAAFAPVFDGHPGVDEVVGLSPQELTLTTWPGKAMDLGRRYAGHPLVDLHDTLRTRMLRLLWRGPVHTFPKHSLRRRLFAATHLPAIGNPLLTHNIAQRYALALEGCAPERPRLIPCLFPQPEELESARGALHRLGLARPLALHPYATHPAKSPAPSWWRRLVHALEGRGIPSLVIGRHRMPLAPGSPRDRTNQDSLRQTIALLSLCRGLVTPDSGPMHLACGVGTPVFALFGPTTAHWGFFPVGQKHHILQAACPKAPCSLHGKTPCPHRTPCLDRLDPQATADAIAAWIQP